MSEQIVAMRREHIDALMPHEREMFGGEAWTRGGYLSELADRKHRTYLAVEDDEGVLLGWGGVRVLADEAEILTVGVIPAARRQGVGSALVHDLLDEARRREANVVFLDVRVANEDAQRIYTREGFVVVGRRRGYYDNGRTDSLTMSLTLTAATP
jgi:ribosomal-protein-alanine N-acetyltransferase